MVAEDGGSPPDHTGGDTFESPARSGASTQHGDATGAPAGFESPAGSGASTQHGDATGAPAGFEPPTGSGASVQHGDAVDAPAVTVGSSPTIDIGSGDWRPMSILGELTNGGLLEYMSEQGAAAEVLDAIEA